MNPANPFLYFTVIDVGSVKIRITKSNSTVISVGYKYEITSCTNGVSFQAWWRS